MLAYQPILYTPECNHEAEILRTYCEGKFPIGESTVGPVSITGEKYTELSVIDYSTPSHAREGAQDRFDKFCEGKSGMLYWRVVPEIALRRRDNKYGYYMRLLISNKPRITEASHG